MVLGNRCILSNQNGSSAELRSGGVLCVVSGGDANKRLPTNIMIFFSFKNWRTFVHLGEKKNVRMAKCLTDPPTNPPTDGRTDGWISMNYN